MTTITLPGRKPILPPMITTLFFTVFVISFFPTILSLHLRWTAWTESYSHGYLLLAIAIYLYAESKKVAPRWLPDIHVPSLVALTIASLGWFLFYLAGITALQQILLPVIVLALIGSLLDANRFWRLLLPMGLLYLAIPIWDELLSLPLQIASARVSAWVVSHTFGIPTAINGFYIAIPAGTFEVASGCAGTVFFLSALTIGIVYGQLFLHRSRMRLLAAFLAALLGILVNWVRIISLIVIGQLSNMRHSLVTEGHLLFGWYLFSGVVLVVILLTLWLARSPSAASRTDARLPPAKLSAKRSALALMALLSGPLLLLALRSFTPAGAAASAPQQLGPHLHQTQVQLPGFVDPTLNVSYSYSLEPDLLVNIVYYPHSFGSGKLISQSNKILPEHAEILEQGRHEATELLPPLLATRIQSRSAARLIWSWYAIGDAIAVQPTEAKFTHLKQALRGHLKGAYVSIALPCRETSCLQEERILAQHGPGIYADVKPFVETLVK